MPVDHTWASRAAAVAVGLLGLLQLGWAARSSHPGLSAAAVVVGVITLLVMAKLARDNCFESRLAAVVLAAAQLMIGMLAVTVGLPGEAPQRTDLMAVATIVSATAVLGLLWADRRARRRRGGPALEPPHYAR